MLKQLSFLIFDTNWEETERNIHCVKQISSMTIVRQKNCNFNKKVNSIPELVRYP